MFNFLKRITILTRIGFAAKKINTSQSEIEKLLAQRALVTLLADARGISTKIGQLFANVEGGSEFQDLTDNVPALPLKKMLPVLEKSLGKSPKKVFKNIEPAVTAASLGQVHFAQLKDGTPIAIKIRYPDITTAVNTELQLAGLIPSIGKVQEWGFNLNAYKKTLFDTLQRELDYRNEATKQKFFRENMRIEGLEIPYVYEELSSDCVLVQSRATGVTFPTVVHWADYERRKIAEILLKTLLVSVFVTGEIHADPHNGNTFYNHSTNDTIVTLLDFGCTVSLQKTRRLALLKLILACREKNTVNPFDCLVVLGFDAEKLAHIQGALPMLCQFLFRPFLVDHVFNLQNWQLEKNIVDLLEEKRWWFRSAGSADLLFLMRAFQGLTQQLQQLQINLNWWELLVQSVDEQTFQQARNLFLPQVNVDIPSVNTLDFASQAKQLHVKIIKNNTPLVSVSMPAEAALNLEDIIPENVRLELSQNNVIDLAKTVKDLKLHGLKPMSLFECKLDEKDYRVWLD